MVFIQCLVMFSALAWLTITTLGIVGLGDVRGRDRTLVAGRELKTLGSEPGDQGRAGYRIDVGKQRVFGVLGAGRVPGALGAKAGLGLEVICHCVDVHSGTILFEVGWGPDLPARAPARHRPARNGANGGTITLL